MAGTGGLSLSFLNVYGEPLDDSVDVSLKHTVLQAGAEVRDQNGSKRLRVTDLDSTQGGTYQLFVFPRRYRPVSRFVTVREGETRQLIISLPADPARVLAIDAPAYGGLEADLVQVLEASELETHPGVHGPELYGALDDVRKAGLLNISAKMRRTVFGNQRNVLSYISSLTRVRGDRFFANIQKELRDEVKNSVASGLFHEVPEALHTPPPGFVEASSFKTFDSYGNLQLSFFNKVGTLDFMVDADIDDAQGIGHVFQVVSHAITGGDTNPYDIHEILLQYQELDPKYRLLFERKPAEATANA